MRKIYGIGETVYDIIFKDGTPQAAKPGGSVLNSMVSLGQDRPSRFIHKRIWHRMMSGLLSTGF